MKLFEQLTARGGVLDQDVVANHGEPEAVPAYWPDPVEPWDEEDMVQVRSEDGTPRDAPLRPRVPGSLHFVTIVLFCGLGGSSWGAEQTGLANVVVAVDWSVECLRTHKANFPGCRSVRGNLHRPRELAECIKIILGGRVVHWFLKSPPCQDVSAAGKRVLTVRTDLTLSSAIFCLCFSPLMIVMENVPQIEQAPQFRAMVELYAKAGYSCGVSLYGAHLVGVGQARIRAFAVFTRAGPGAVVRFMRVARRRWWGRVTAIRDVLSHVGPSLYQPNRAPGGPCGRDTGLPASTFRRNCLSRVPARYQAREGDAAGVPHQGTIAEMALLAGVPVGGLVPANRSLAGDQLGNSVAAPAQRAVLLDAVDAGCSRQECHAGSAWLFSSGGECERLTPGEDPWPLERRWQDVPQPLWVRRRAQRGQKRFERERQRESCRQAWGVLVAAVLEPPSLGESKEFVGCVGGNARCLPRWSLAPEARAVLEPMLGYFTHLVQDGVAVGALRHAARMPLAEYAARVRRVGGLDGHRLLVSAAGPTWQQDEELEEGVAAARRDGAMIAFVLSEESGRRARLAQRGKGTLHRVGLNDHLQLAQSRGVWDVWVVGGEPEGSGRESLPTLKRRLRGWLYANLVTGGKVCRDAGMYHDMQTRYGLPGVRPSAGSAAGLFVADPLRGKQVVPAGSRLLSLAAEARAEAMVGHHLAYCRLCRGWGKEQGPFLVEPERARRVDSVPKLVAVRPPVEELQGVSEARLLGERAAPTVTRPTRGKPGKGSNRRNRRKRQARGRRHLGRGRRAAVTIQVWWAQRRLAARRVRGHCDPRLHPNCQMAAMDSQTKYGIWWSTEGIRPDRELPGGAPRPWAPSVFTADGEVDPAAEKALKKWAEAKAVRLLKLPAAALWRPRWVSRRDAEMVNLHGVVGRWGRVLWRAVRAARLLPGGLRPSRRARGRLTVEEKWARLVLRLPWRWARNPSWAPDYCMPLQVVVRAQDVFRARVYGGDPASRMVCCLNVNHNDHTPTAPFGYSGPMVVCSFLRPGDWTALYDLSNYYLTLMVHPSMYKFFVYLCPLDQRYKYLVGMPFGARLACFYSSRYHAEIKDAIAGRARHQRRLELARRGGAEAAVRNRRLSALACWGEEPRANPYIDDGLLAGMNRPATLAATVMALRLLAEARFPVRDPKVKWPRQAQKYLGLWFASAEVRSGELVVVISIDEERREYLAAQVQLVLKQGSGPSLRKLLGDMRSVAGGLMYGAMVQRGGRGRLASLYILISIVKRLMDVSEFAPATGEWRAKRLSSAWDEAASDMRWWLRQLKGKSWAGSKVVTLRQVNPACANSDAAGVLGWGIHKLEGTVAAAPGQAEVTPTSWSLQRPWTDEQLAWSSMHAKEFVPVVEGAHVLSVAGQWKDRLACFGIDNAGLVLSILAGRARDLESRKMMRQLSDLQVERCFDVLARWVPREFNVVADLLSRQIPLWEALRSLTDPVLAAALKVRSEEATEQRIVLFAVRYPALALKLREDMARGARFAAASG